MKLSLPLKPVTILALFVTFFLGSKAQSSLDGGTVAISAPCYSLSLPAPVVNSVTPATGGTAPYSYQWQAKINPSLWVDVIGGTNATLTPGLLFNVTSYRRKATDATGAEALSNTITFQSSDNLNGGSIRLWGYNPIIVNTVPPPIFSTGSAFDGSGSYSYSWETATNASGPWSTISGITTLDYQPAAISTVGSTYFRRKAVDNNCGSSAYSNTEVITTVLTMPFNPKDWTTQYLCVFPGFAPTVLTGKVATGGTPPYSYQWEQQTVTGSWTTIPSATGISYQPPVITETTKYRRRASDAAGAFGYSNEDAIVYATSTPNPGLIAGNQTWLIAPNAPSNAVLSIQSASNFNNGYYSWESSTDNGSNWAPVPNYWESILYLEASPTVTTCYRRAIHDACASLDRAFYTNTVCISPAIPLDPGTITSSNSSSCVGAGTSVGVLNGTPATGGRSPYTYQWQKNDDGNWVNIVGANTVNYTPSAINHNTSYRRKVTDDANTVLYTNEIAVGIQSNTVLKGGIVDGPIITCSGTAPGIINNIIDACGGGGNLQYTWESSTGSSSWAAITNTNAPTHNAGSISADTKYRRRVGDGCGSAAYSNEVEVFVYPAIEAGTITPINQSICNSVTPEALTLMQNCHYTNGNVSYQWQTATAASGPWTNVAGTAGVQAFYQPRAGGATVYYRLQVTSSVCGAVAYSNVATINVTNCAQVEQGKVAANTLPSNLSTKGNMKVYPNPATQGQTVFVTVDGGDGAYKAALRSTDGRMYNCTVTSLAKGQLQVKLPQPMAKGTYLIQVSNNQKQWIERILVQ